MSIQQFTSNLEPEDELHGGAARQCTVVRMLDEADVESREHEHQS